MKTRGKRRDEHNRKGEDFRGGKAKQKELETVRSEGLTGGKLRRGLKGANWRAEQWEKATWGTLTKRKGVNGGGAEESLSEEGQS